MDRKTTFGIALLYLTILLVLGLLFFVTPGHLGLPACFGPVPVGVPWFGALGAVVISLTGVFEHKHDWDPSYWPWHLARPLIGVALGVVSVLILQAGVLAVGSTPIQPGSTQTQATPSPTPQAQSAPSAGPTPQTQPTPSAGPTAQTQPTQSPGSTQTQSPKVPRNLLYYLVAFLVGYREETFRELIKRLVDLILTPGNGAGPVPTIHGVDPAKAPHATPTQVVITGSGFTGAQSVKFGNNPAPQFTVNSDGQLTVTTPTLPDGGAFPVTVPLTVTNKAGSATGQFTFS